MKIYDLEIRTLNFAKEIFVFYKKYSKLKVSKILLDQLLRSGTSIGANYREANDSLGDKDFYFRVRTSRKEAKECIYWLEILKEDEAVEMNCLQELIKECNELKMILSAIAGHSNKHN